MITLRNSHIIAGIHPKGAELQSLRRANGMEYMWSGDQRYWGKFSPVLFPIVGSLVKDTYTYGGNTYQLPRHGFARDRVFEVHHESDAKAVFTLRSDEASMRVYPFAFELRLVYTLDESTLRCRYEVDNEGTGDMLFSIGGHPAFAVPLDQVGAYTDYYLELEQPEPLFRYKLDNGLLTLHTQPLALEDDRRLPLDPSLFYEDAIVLRHLRNHRISLRSRLHSHGLHFHFAGFPYFGIWAAKDAPFVCLEPWCGHADWADHNGDLAQKDGIISLSAGQTWQREWAVEVF